MAFERDPNEIGVLWSKTSARGDYMTGSVEIDGVKHPVVLFKNGNKRNKKSPDWRILKATPREKLASADEDAPF
jgi:uncharacterized protein (DUF736 family)